MENVVLRRVLRAKKQRNQYSVMRFIIFSLYQIDCYKSGRMDYEEASANDE